MRKIISAILVVVMLAALAVAFPASAAAPAGLVITEINADTAAIRGDLDALNSVTATSKFTNNGLFFDGSVWAMTNSDIFEFVEVYNPTNEAINLYDYTITVKDGDAAAADAVEKFTPIASPAQMKEYGNKLGTVSTLKAEGDKETDYISTAVWSFYPTNPEKAELAPGATAVIWMYNGDAYAYNAVASKSIPSKNEDLAINFDSFRTYWGLEEDTLVVAVDANASTSGISLKKFDGAALENKGNNPVSSNYEVADGNSIWADKKVKPNGVDSAAKDMLATAFSAAAGRFNISNSGIKTYGLGKTESFKAAAPAHSALTSYATVDYESTDAAKNLMYAATAGIQAGSYADVSYNFTYDEATGAKAKALVCQYATPCFVTEAQAADMVALGSTAKDVCVNNIYKVDEEITIYTENFDKIDADAEFKVADAREALGWERQWQQNGDLFTTNKVKIYDIDANSEKTNNVLAVTENKKYANVATILTSKEIIELAEKLDGGKDLLNADLSYEFDVKFTGGGTSGADRWVGLAINGNAYDAYELFALTPVGTAVSLRSAGRTWSDGQRINLDKEGKNYSRNTDANSVISKLTDGFITAGSPTDTAVGDNLKMVDQGWVHVEMVYDQDKGLYAYVNDILVSEPVNAAVVGLARYKGDYAVGLYVASNVLFEVDNIEIKAIPEVSVNLDKIYANSDSMEPKTGDAVIYVAVAMVVSFISLAALVVVKKRTEK